MLPIISGTTTDRVPAPLSCYRLDLSGGSKDRPQSTVEDSSEAAEESPLLCTICSAPITTGKEAISVNGLHDHVFFNPSGIAFDVRCFQKAPGCLIQGNPTTDFSWFAGYSWQYAFCATCLSHLGWWFRSDDGDSFFGLIATRLIE